MRREEGDEENFSAFRLAALYRLTSFLFSDNRL